MPPLHSEEIKMLATKVPEIEEAYKVMKRFSQDEEVRLLYDSREKAIRDEQTRLLGWSVMQVTQLTSLTIPEAEEIQRQVTSDRKTKSIK